VWQERVSPPWASQLILQNGSIEVLVTASQIAKEMLYISSVSGIEGDASVSITL